MPDNELQHWGIKGMKWGHRRYQNKDGSLTPAGRERYSDDDGYEQYHKDRAKQERKERNKRFIQAGATAAIGALAVVGIKKYLDSKNSGATTKGENFVKDLLTPVVKKDGASSVPSISRDWTLTFSKKGKGIIDGVDYKPSAREIYSRSKNGDNTPKSETRASSAPLILPASSSASKRFTLASAPYNKPFKKQYNQPSMLIQRQLALPAVSSVSQNIQKKTYGGTPTVKVQGRYTQWYLKRRNKN